MKGVFVLAWFLNSIFWLSLFEIFNFGILNILFLVPFIFGVKLLENGEKRT